MPARERLRQLLASHSDLEIAGEADSGTEAMEMVSRLRPDLLLLDIQMPGCSGMGVAACLPKPRPYIIFCTAYDRHAVDAFELHALDYLLKPVTRARLALALDRLRALSSGTQEPGLDRAIRTQRTGPVRFLVRSSSRYLVVAEQRVLCFCSEDGLTTLTSDHGKYFVETTLNELESWLDPARFFRISRSAMINLNAIVEVRPLAGGAGEVVVKGGQRLEVSRRRFQDLLQTLRGVSHRG